MSSDLENYEQALKYLTSGKHATVLHPLDSGSEFFVQAETSSSGKVELDLGDGFRAYEVNDAIKALRQKIKEVKV